jgi:hypothetical protein
MLVSSPDEEALEDDFDAKLLSERRWRRSAGLRGVSRSPLAPVNNRCEDVLCRGGVDFQRCVAADGRERHTGSCPSSIGGTAGALAPAGESAGS